MNDFDNRTLFETIFKQSPISTQVFSPSGKTIMVNKAWETLWGISFTKLSSYNVLEDKQLVEAGIMKFIKRGFKGETVSIPAIKYEPAKTLKIKGTVPFRWISAIIYPIRNSSGKIQYLVLQHEDITEQKNSERALRLSEERHRLVVEIGKIGVWDWNIANNKLSWSKRVYEIYGADPKQFKVNFKQFSKLIHPEDKIQTEAAIKKALDGTRPYNVTFRILTVAGETRWIKTNATVQRDIKGKPVRMLGAISDVTEHMRLDQDKNDFISIATHELKTPVTSLKAYAQTLQRKFINNDDIISATQLGKMNSQLDKLTTLISDLLDTTKIDSGKMQMSKEKFNFDELIQEIVEELERTTDKHKLIIKHKTRKVIYADRERLGQVLTNLISNAIKYSPNTDKIVINASATEVQVKVCVQDFGIGIPKAKQSKLFERFYRVNGPRDNTFPGLGLGLYISSEIIKRHKGKIWVESIQDKGSNFCFLLPISTKLT